MGWVEAPGISFTVQSRTIGAEEEEVSEAHGQGGGPRVDLGMKER